MGLGSFKWRLLIVIITVILLWQTSKVWLSFLEDSSETKELQLEQTATLLSYKDNSVEQKIHVAVYYEALCPDSRSFFVKQLMPTYRKITANLVVEPIPYGKATKVETKNGYEFTCQHGPIECQANIIHACSIDVIKDPSIQLDFLTCMIKNNMEPIEIMNKCAESISVDLESIKRCSDSERGKGLLNKYGDMTNSLVPRVSFIPTITLDGSSKYQARILKNLLREVCLQFKVVPKECVS